MNRWGWVMMYFRWLVIEIKAVGTMRSYQRVDV